MPPAPVPYTDEVAENIRRWQTAGWVHPLTCKESSHRELEPFNNDGNLGLKCLDCDYVQTWVPGICLTGPGRNPFRRDDVQPTPG